MQVRYGKTRQWGYIFQGFLIVLIGILLISFKQFFIARVSEVVGLIMLFDGALRFFSALKKHPSRKNERLNSILIASIELVLASVLFFYPGQTVRWLIGFIGFYHSLLGIINVITLYLLIKNRANNVIPHALMTSLHFILAVIAFSANKTSLNILNIMGVYIILIGLTFIQDGRRVFISKNKEEKWRRKIRFPLPIFLSVLIPRRVLAKINRFLENEFMTEDLRQRYMTLPSSETGQKTLEILIHTSRYGLGIIGHVNIAYKGKVFNFGNHDKESRYLLGAIGDGVLAVVDKDPFIEVSMAAGDTIFEFVVALNDQQVEALEEKFLQLKGSLVPWTLETEAQIKGYAGFLQRRADADLYKFNKGKFKNYYVFGNNCVQLSDEIIGVSGLDLFAMVGFLTPGTYFDYLNREYKKDGSIVIGRRVHNRKLRKEMKALANKSA